MNRRAFLGLLPAAALAPVAAPKIKEVFATRRTPYRGSPLVAWDPGFDEGTVITSIDYATRTITLNRRFKCGAGMENFRAGQAVTRWPSE